MQDFARYETPAAIHRQFGLVCTGTGYSLQKTALCPRRRLACYAAVWVSSGSGWLETSATPHRIHIPAQSLFWLFPQVTHSFAPDSTGWTEQWVLFEGTLAATFEQLGFLSPTQPICSIDSPARVETILSQLHADFTSDDPFAGILAATRVQQLIILAYQQFLASRAGDESSPGQMELVRQWLDAHAFEPLDFEQVAKIYHMGYSTLRRHFKQATGYSPKEYVLRARLTKAKELLAFTQQSINEVANNTGFGDPYYFSRLFHLKEGISPSLFRTQQRSIPR